MSGPTDRLLFPIRPDPAVRVRTSPRPMRAVPLAGCTLDLVVVEHGTEPPPLLPLNVGPRLWLALWTLAEARGYG